MAKKRVKKDSVKTETKAQTSKKTQKKPSKIILWAVVALVLIILIIILVLVLPKQKYEIKPTQTTCELNNYTCFNNSCLSGYAEIGLDCKAGQVCCKKIPIEPEKNQCEKAGLTCYASRCPFGYADIDLFCSASDVCCKKIVVEDRTACEKQGLQCFASALPEPACPTNYIPDSHTCRSGEICCKEDSPNNEKFVLYGYVKLKEGNCMPPVGPNCTTNPLTTQVAIFYKTPRSQMQGDYFRTAIGPIKITTSDEKGYYEVELPYGEYSVFARDPKNNDYYCNIFFGDSACFAQLINSKQFDILIDHSAQ